MGEPVREGSGASGPCGGVNNLNSRLPANDYRRPRQAYTTGLIALSKNLRIIRDTVFHYIPEHIILILRRKLQPLSFVGVNDNLLELGLSFRQKTRICTPCAYRVWALSLLARLFRRMARPATARMSGDSRIGTYNATPKHKAFWLRSCTMTLSISGSKR